MTFEEWFKEKFGRLPSDSERDSLLRECFMAGRFYTDKVYGNHTNYETRKCSHI